MTPATPAVTFRGVSKHYPFFALQDVSFRLEPGQILGLVGPNGAGKSTTLRILLGLVHQDEGDVELLGCRMPDEQVQAKWDVGFVSEEMRLFGGATLEWHLDFVRSIFPGAWDDRYAEKLLKRFHLHREQKVKGLSRGEQVKAALLLALARRPRLLVLDEPTTGLDPVARHEVIGELMEGIADEERSVLSSHNTLDVEQISDAIVFLDRGRIVDTGDKETFVERWRRIQLELPDGTALPALDGVVDVARSGRTAVVTANAFVEAMPAALREAGAVVREVQRMTLEEIFVATVMHKRKERGE